MSYDLSLLSSVAANLDSFERDCAITVALKITDDSCKMDDYEKSVFMALYDALPEQTSLFFDPAVFTFIAQGRSEPSARVFAQIKVLREEAMASISRPKMKAFKAVVRVRLSAEA
jgi:hypothetical protein